MLVLEGGEVAPGDCCAVQYSGAGGRDPLFMAEQYIPLMDKHLKKELIGRDSTHFKQNAEFFDKLKSWQVSTAAYRYKNVDKMILKNVDYLAKLEKEVAPFQLRIEAPVDAGSRQGQVEALKKICELITEKGLSVEAVLLCKEKGTRAFWGGSCAETDISSRAWAWMKALWSLKTRWSAL
ncbi:hypothetical protein ES703_42732 [subsurface metagenome]